MSAALVLRTLQRLEHGRLEVALPGGERRAFGASDSARADLEVRSRAAFARILRAGDIGFAEGYLEGEWTTSDLHRLLTLLAANREPLERPIYGSLLGRLANRLLHLARANTRSGSRRNIAAHYDLGNDFFALFLDPTMMYSSAIFAQPNMTLEAAQLARLDHICRKLDLTPRDHLLEIGTGWGGMAIYAARHYGCRVTTTTISQEQYKLASERVRAAGLEDHITVLLKDYRDLAGSYDKLVSIEMIEAVGHDFYDSYFGKCGALLKPDGLMLLQAITIADQRYDVARKSVDFIQRYIFPGSCIPSVTVMSASITRASDLRLAHLEDIGPHYATTLRLWRENFLRNIEAVRALGYPESFVRVWEFYLCYCEGGFAERALGDVHMLLAKPGNRRDPIVAPLVA
jgi:cyclopropane-fatty-acyl-phospholipid synthase